VSKYVLSALLAATGLVSAPVYAEKEHGDHDAEDGVVLIDQSVVHASGGFPYTITRPGSYRLSGNLVVSGNTDGIDVVTPNVTIDLNGFSISGQTSNFYGIHYPATTCAPALCGALVIRNGAVLGFRYGIFLDTVGSVIEHVTLSNYSSAGIYFGGGSTGTVSHCTTTGASGVFLGGTGITVYSGIVDSNNVTGDFEGISVGGRARVTGNFVVATGFALAIETNISDPIVIGSNVLSGGTDSILNGGPDQGLVSQHNNACQAGSSIATSC
jgi:hypothetical protein